MKIQKIPYGISNFINLRQSDYYYVDKTRFIPVLEEMGKYLFLIRPRRMGKSLWLSLLETYYDILLKDQFEEFFSGTEIYRIPTPGHNSYLILKFNFSLINPNPDLVEESFEEEGKAIFDHFISKYSSFLEKDNFLSQLEETNRTADKLKRLFRYCIEHNLKLYVLVDEYDNFTNTILSTSGQQKYHELTHGAGFYRYFFNMLKGGTSETGQGDIRFFITGVSPVTMDDVTSGFNIGMQVSLEESLNELIGFTEPEVEMMLLDYHKMGLISLTAEKLLPLMKEWYDGYRFASSLSQSLYNSDMVLYFLGSLVRRKKIPEELIDHNVRIDYGKLRHLIAVDQRLNGNFSRLKEIMEKGRVRAHKIATSFPIEKLNHSSNFYSLLYYFGLLTFEKKEGSANYLCIPNRTVYQLMYGYIRDAYEDVNCFQLDLWKFADLIYQMSYEGEWKAAFQFLAEEIKKQTSVRDYLSNEKSIQGFLLAYLNVADYFLSYSEVEFNKGYCDFFLEPFWDKYSDLKYAYLVELKYIQRGEKKLEQEKEKQFKEAQKQLNQYAQDPQLKKRIQSAELIKVILIFHGWELILLEKVD